MKNIAKQLETIADEFHSEALRDYVGLWQIVSHLSMQTDPPTGELLQRFTLLIITQLLETGLVAGKLTPDGGFEQWANQEPAYVLERIAKEWKELAQDPDIGDICWFNLPK